MSETWPALPYDSWSDTLETLHRYSQIVGKIQLEQTPRVNHWWNVGMRVSSRGLVTGPMQFDGGTFEIEFDFIDHNLLFRTSMGAFRALALTPRTVANFYAEVFGILDSLGIAVAISDLPCEIPTDAIRFREDQMHASYDPVAANTWWRITVQGERVLEQFRSPFIGKCSPVVFYWGSFDLAVTRFSGRRAPPRPDADSITREAYSHEVSSAGLWPGTAELGGPAFYSYMAPSPDGFAEARVPEAAYFDRTLGEFLLPYSAVREADNPDALLLSFLQSTYEAGAGLAGWDRQRLERGPVDWARARGAEPSPVLH